MATHNNIGRWGEDIACDELLRAGYTIRERNWRMGHYEIDIIATRGDVMAFVEVKTRSNPEDDPVEAIDRKKILHMVRSANAYLRSSDLDFFPRFDIFAIRGNPEAFEVEYIPDAFQNPLI